MTYRLNKQPHPFLLNLLTPVSIGSGKTLEPMRYTIDKDDSGFGTLHYIDLDQWLDDHAEETQLQRALDGSPLEIRSYLHDSLHSKTTQQNLQEYSLQQFQIRDQSLVNKFFNNMKGPGSRNQLKVAEAFKNSNTGRLVLPGSSIKGALLTPIIDYLDQKYQLNMIKDYNNEYKTGFQNAMQNTFGSIKDNSFKALKVSDLESLYSDGEVFSAVARRKSKEENGNPNDDTEALASGITLGGTLSLGFNADSSGILSIPNLKTELNWKEICQIVTDFFQSRFHEEWKEFYSKDWFKETQELLTPIKERIDKIQPDQGELLLRVGHYSHSRCVTIENSKPMAKKGKDGKRQGPNTTRTLANGLLPFGWVILKECSWDELQNHQNKLEKDWQERFQKNEKKRLENNNKRLAEKQAERERNIKEEQEKLIEAAKLEGERLIPKAENISDWSQAQQFAEHELMELSPQEYVPELGVVFKKIAMSFEIPKKKLKKDPDLLEKRGRQVDEWLNRFEKKRPEAPSSAIMME